MKLLGKDDQVTLFKSGIEVDKSLLKYKTLIENTTEKVQLKSENEDEINVSFNRILESKSNQYLFLDTKKKRLQLGVLLISYLILKILSILMMQENLIY